MRINQFPVHSSPDGGEYLPIFVKSSSVTISASTISAQASDQSYNDSGSGFVTAGFALGDSVVVEGFTGNTANNILVAVITALTAAKMTIGGADGSVIVDDAAGETVVITKWDQKIINLAGFPVNKGKHAVPIMAGGMNPSTTNGCAALAKVEIAANQPELITLDFDATTEEYALFGIWMPSSWNEGTITFKVAWSHPSTATNFGVVWGLQALAVGDDDAIGAAFGTAQTVTDTGGTTNDLYISPESSAITVGGTPQAGDYVFFRVYRKAADASDNLAVDARLHSVTVFITTDEVVDA